MKNEFVPLERMGKALDILKNKAAKPIESKKVKSFMIKFVNYIEKTWINGNFPPKTWNFFGHLGSTTINYAEGFNSKLAKNRSINKYPNVYLLSTVIKEELLEGIDDASVCGMGMLVRKARSKLQKSLNSQKQ